MELPAEPEPEQQVCHLLTDSFTAARLSLVVMQGTCQQDTADSVACHTHVLLSCSVTYDMTATPGRQQHQRGAVRAVGRAGARAAGGSSFTDKLRYVIAIASCEKQGRCRHQTACSVSTVFAYSMLPYPCYDCQNRWTATMSPWRQFRSCLRSRRPRRLPRCDRPMLKTAWLPLALVHG